MDKVRFTGQNVSEFAIGLVIIALAIVGIQLYLQRSLQAKYKAGVDYMISEVGKATGKSVALQFEPNYRESEMTSNKEETKERYTQKEKGLSVDFLNSEVGISGWSRIDSLQNAE